MSTGESADTRTAKAVIMDMVQRKNYEPASLPGLPRELRDMIYAHLTTKTEYCVVGIAVPDDHIRRTLPRTWYSLMLANRQLHDEVFEHLPKSISVRLYLGQPRGREGLLTPKTLSKKHWIWYWIWHELEKWSTIELDFDAWRVQREYEGLEFGANPEQQVIKDMQVELRTFMVWWNEYSAANHTRLIVRLDNFLASFYYGPRGQGGGWKYFAPMRAWLTAQKAKLGGRLEVRISPRLYRGYGYFYTYKFLVTIRDLIEEKDRILSI